MSVGLICSCIDPRHPRDERSDLERLGFRSRCRSYAVDQVSGGRCQACIEAGHSWWTPRAGEVIS